MKTPPLNENKKNESCAPTAQEPNVNKDSHLNLAQKKEDSEKEDEPTLYPDEFETPGAPRRYSISIPQSEDEETNNQKTPDCKVNDSKEK